MAAIGRIPNQELLVLLQRAGDEGITTNFHPDGVGQAWQARILFERRKYVADIRAGTSYCQRIF